MLRLICRKLNSISEVYPSVTTMNVINVSLSTYRVHSVPEL